VPRLYNSKSQKPLRQKLRSPAPYPEAKLWQYLQGKQLLGYKFRRQHGIGRYVVDFYCPQLKLAIELDGDSHFNDQAQEADLIRQRFLEAKGIQVLRFSNLEVVNNLETVIENIKMHLV
jgi:very-short-patch-repair endonuclease